MHLMYHILIWPINIKLIILQRCKKNLYVLKKCKFYNNVRLVKICFLANSMLYQLNNKMLFFLFTIQVETHISTHAHTSLLYERIYRLNPDLVHGWTHFSPSTYSSSSKQQNQPNMIVEEIVCGTIKKKVSK